MTKQAARGGFRYHARRHNCYSQPSASPFGEPSFLRVGFDLESKGIMLQSARSIRLGLANEEFRAATRRIVILASVVVCGTLGLWYIEHDNNWDLWKWKTPPLLHL